MSMQLSSKLGGIVIVILLVGFMSSCKSTAPSVALDPEVDLDSDTRHEFEKTVNKDILPGINLSDGNEFRDAGLDEVYFDYNSFALRPDSLDTLKRNANIIRQDPGTVFQIEGHCDERGTQEYNLALGERRALAVRSHLIELGVSGDRLITISYGEENPANMDHDETAWSQNRRAAFNR